MLFFCLFQCFEEKEYQTESKRNETFGRVIFGTEAIQETWRTRQGSFEVATRQGGAPAPWILEVTLEYLGDIRVLVDLCLKVLF